MLTDGSRPKLGIPSKFPNWSRETLLHQNLQMKHATHWLTTNVWKGLFPIYTVKNGYTGWNTGHIRTT